MVVTQSISQQAHVPTVVGELRAKAKALHAYQLNVVCKSAAAEQALAQFWRICREHGLQEQQVNLVRQDGVKQVRLLFMVRCDAQQRRALVQFVREMNEIDAVRQASLATAPCDYQH